MRLHGQRCRRAVQLVLAIVCSISGPVESLLQQRTASRAPQHGLDTRLWRRGDTRPVMADGRQVLRGGAAGDEEDLAGILDGVARMKVDAAQNPPLPALVESAIQVLDVTRCGICSPVRDGHFRSVETSVPRGCLRPCVSAPTIDVVASTPELAWLCR